MEPRPTYERLLDYVLGESTPAEARQVEAMLESDAELREETACIRLVIGAVRDLPVADVSEQALQRLFAAARESSAAREPAPVIHLRAGLWQYAWRVAAALMIGAIVVFGLSQMPPGPGPTVARVIDGDRAWLQDGEVLESAIGSRPRLQFATGEVLLDGAGAVRLSRRGEFGPPVIDVIRGRVVLTATGAALEARVAEQTLNLEPGSSVALEYEHEFQRVSEDGRVVQIQRLPLARAAELGAQVYGMKIDACELPAQVAGRRISFTGADMDAGSFVASLVQAASRFGVSDFPARDGVKLVYSGVTDSGEGLDKAAVQIAVLAGGATVSRNGEQTRLHESRGENSFQVTTGQGAGAQVRSSDALARMVAWAGGLESAAVEARLRDVSARAGRLPRGAVIHSDRLVLRKEGEVKDRVFLLGSAEFTFPLGGRRLGRPVSVLSTGVEFEVNGETRREFLPLAVVSR